MGRGEGGGGRVGGKADHLCSPINQGFCRPFTDSTDIVEYTDRDGHNQTVCGCTGQAGSLLLAYGNCPKISNTLFHTILA